jgi:hypothetical protein
MDLDLEDGSGPLKVFSQTTSCLWTMSLGNSDLDCIMLHGRMIDELEMILKAGVMA